MNVTIPKILGIGALVAMIFGGIQGTVLAFQTIQTLYAGYVEDKISTYETRLENTTDGVNDKSERIYAYDGKVERGEVLDPFEKERVRNLKNSREKLQTRAMKQEAQLEKWEDRLE